MPTWICRCASRVLLVAVGLPKLLWNVRFALPGGEPAGGLEIENICVLTLVTSGWLKMLNASPLSSSFQDSHTLNSLASRKSTFQVFGIWKEFAPRNGTRVVPPTPREPDAPPGAVKISPLAKVCCGALPVTVGVNGTPVDTTTSGENVKPFTR